MSRAPNELELPRERAALLKWNFTSEVQDQLKALASSNDAVVDLCERLEYVEQSGDGSLDSWY